LLPHIIHRQVFDLYLQPHAVESDIAERLKNAFYNALPRVEAIFYLYDDPDRLIRIDKLSLDLGVFNPENIGDLFSSRLCDALLKAFRASISISTKGNKIKKEFRSESVSGKNKPAEWGDLFSDKIFADPVIDKIEYFSEKEGISHAFLYFLANGVFPWWVGEHVSDNKEIIFSSLPGQSSASYRETVRRFLAEDSNALRRLLYQFPETFIEKLLVLFKQQVHPEVLHLYEINRQHYFFRNKQVSRQEAMIYKDNWLCFKILLTNNVTEAVNILTQHLAQLIWNNDTTVETISGTLKSDPWLAYQREILDKLSALLVTANEKQLTAINDLTEFNSNVVSIEKVKFTEEDDENLTTDEPIDKFLYVNFAGLVILHPFLHQFFFRLGLLNDKLQFNNEASRIKAVYLLAFLASGEMDNSEDELPFCKFLCGMPVKTAIIKYISINNNEIEECEQLLNEVINHWFALKNISIQGLREGFLNRKGKLDFREETVVLFVETRSHDILLERLPWEISFIQLPWINHPFTTMWY